MPIKVACSCGQSFAAPDHLAGRAVKCPKCGQPLNIPAVQQPAPQQPAAPLAPAAGGAMADLLAEEGLSTNATGGRQCPSCNSPMAAQGFICTSCGFNVQTGRKMQVEDSLANMAQRDAEEMLRKANKQLKETPQEFSASDLGSGANAYIAAGVILLVTGVLIGLAFVFFYIFDEYIYTEDAESNTAGIMTMVFGGVFGSIGGIWLLVVAFMEDILKGVLCLVIPFYFLWFVLTKIGEQKLPATLYLMGFVMQIAGCIMLGLS